MYVQQQQQQYIIFSNIISVSFPTIIVHLFFLTLWHHQNLTCWHHPFVTKSTDFTTRHCFSPKETKLQFGISENKNSAFVIPNRELLYETNMLNDRLFVDSFSLSPPSHRTRHAVSLPHWFSPHQSTLISRFLLLNIFMNLIYIILNVWWYKLSELCCLFAV